MTTTAAPLFDPSDPALRRDPYPVYRRPLQKAPAWPDTDEFPDCEAFDVTRSVNRHLPFGVGHHLCVGANLARMEARVAVRRVLERFPTIRLDPDRPAQFRPNLQLRGFASLPVLVG
jgi:cytochrome P450